MKISLIKLKNKNVNTKIKYWCVLKNKHKIKDVLGYLTKTKTLVINYNRLIYYLNIQRIIVSSRILFQIKQFLNTKI